MSRETKREGKTVQGEEGVRQLEGFAALFALEATGVIELVFHLGCFLKLISLWLALKVLYIIVALLRAGGAISRQLK